MKMFRMLAIVAMLVCAAAANAQSTQRGFSVVLLLGETQSTSAGDGLPPAPTLRKALSDVKDFLPYKSYRVLDTQWLRSGMTLMKGVDDQEYEVTVEAGEFQRMGALTVAYDPASGKPPVIILTFRLQESGAATMAGEEYARSMQAADLEKQLASLKALLSNAQGAMLQEQKARIARVERQIRLARARKLLESRIEMAPGETVVVGTSRIGGGDRGLVVLLTAVNTGK
jgi:hypothetical protein